MKRVFSYREIDKLRVIAQDKRTVLVGGCFDIFHHGHLTFLKNAKKVGNFLIIALESDQFIIKKKKKKPVHNQRQRAEILSSLYFVDAVLMLPFFKSGKDYSDLVKRIRPAVIAVSEGDPLYIKKTKQAKEIGAVVIRVSSLFKGFSTSRILHILSSQL